MNAYLKDKEVSESEYDDYLDSIDGKIYAAGMTFYASDILKNCDPIAYRIGKDEYEDTLDDVWVCGECGEEYKDEEDAKICCGFECECGALWETEAEMEACCFKEEESEDEDEDN